MQRPIRPTWLLRQADELAGRAKGVGQPRNADLRRAVSAAYYALFHHIVLNAVGILLPASDDEDRWRLARHFDHGAIRQVCLWIANPNQAPSHARASMQSMAANRALADVANAFATLMTARHEADYDHLARFTRPEALSMVDGARDAMRKLDLLTGTKDHEVFVVHLALQTKLR